MEYRDELRNSELLKKDSSQCRWLVAFMVGWSVSLLVFCAWVLSNNILAELQFNPKFRLLIRHVDILFSYLQKLSEFLNAYRYTISA
jgi:hypothetical protein